MIIELRTLKCICDHCGKIEIIQREFSDDVPDDWEWVEVDFPGQLKLFCRDKIHELNFEKLMQEAKKNKKKSKKKKIS